MQIQIQKPHFLKKEKASTFESTSHNQEELYRQVKFQKSETEETEQNRTRQRLKL
jgi:hypothetical protein